MAPDNRQDATGGATSLSMVRALATLVDRLSNLGTPAQGAPAVTPVERRDAVREALRALAGAARTHPLQCRVDEAGLHVNDQIVLPAELRAQPSMYGLARRMVLHQVGSLSIRQGAAPGELLTLAKLLAEAPQKVRAAASDAGDGPRRAAAQDVLRSWSVLVTPASTPVVEEPPVPAPVSTALTRLRGARSDDATRQAVSDLLDLANEAEGRQDAAMVEAIAVSLAAHARGLGSGEGRLATEGGLRRLLREGIVTLLAARVPDSTDREMLVSMLARTGEMGGKALVSRLLTSEDRPARRSYFDAIVAQGSGVPQLREALSDPRWFVVRNAAALLGEMGMTDEDASLIPLLAQLDDRIRVAAARALTRLGTTRGLAALQLRLNDPNAEVRRLAAASFARSGGTITAVKPHSAALGNALATELEEDVILEIIASLGKIASADAVQRLIRLAVGERGALVSAHPGWFRVAALEALVLARGHAAVPTLEVLATDANAEVAAAAQRLLGRVLTT